MQASWGALLSFHHSLWWYLLDLWSMWVLSRKGFLPVREKSHNSWYLHEPSLISEACAYIEFSVKSQSRWFWNPRDSLSHRSHWVFSVNRRWRFMNASLRGRALPLVRIYPLRKTDEGALRACRYFPDSLLCRMLRGYVSQYQRFYRYSLLYSLQGILRRFICLIHWLMWWCRNCAMTWVIKYTKMRNKCTLRREDELFLTSQESITPHGTTSLFISDIFFSRDLSHNLL